MGCFGGSKASGSDRASTSEALYAAQQRILELSDREATLTAQLAASQAREQALQQEASLQQDRQQHMDQALAEQQAQLRDASDLASQHEARAELLEAKHQDMAVQVQNLQAQLEGKRRQTKAFANQVAELKAELAKKHKQQEHLKSKYLKMQEAMKMLEEVVVCVVGGPPDMGTSNRGAPGPRPSSQLPRSERPAPAPGADIVAKRFNILRASANELRQSLAALSMEDRKEKALLTADAGQQMDLAKSDSGVGGDNDALAAGWPVNDQAAGTALATAALGLQQ